MAMPIRKSAVAAAADAVAASGVAVAATTALSRRRCRSKVL
jgi:hypothetical protein